MNGVLKGNLTSYKKVRGASVRIFPKINLKVETDMSSEQYRRLAHWRTKRGVCIS